MTLNPSLPLRPFPADHADSREWDGCNFEKAAAVLAQMSTKDIGKMIAKIPAAEYPPALLAARKAEFVAKLRAYTDPDTVDGPSDVSEWQDERNSRPFPY